MLGDILVNIRDITKKIPIGIKSASAYVIASVLTRGLAIITIPIFTRLLTTEQMGTVNLYNTWSSNLSIITSLAITSGGLGLAMKEFETERDEYTSSILLIPTIMSAVLLLIYRAAPDFFQHILGLSNGLILFMLFGLMVSPATAIWMYRKRYEYKYMQSSLFSFGVALISCILSIYVVTYMKKNNPVNIVEGKLISSALISYGASFILYISMMLKGRTLFSKKYWIFSLQLSLPLVGYSFSNQILMFSDRIMISKMVDNSAVGIYSLLYNVSSLSDIVWNAMIAAYIPFLYQNFDSQKDKIRKITDILLIFYAGVAIILTFFAPEIVWILATEEYYESVNIMPPIACGIFYMAVFGIYTPIFIYYKKTGYLMVTTSITAVLNIILNVIFIPLFGYQAAAYTTLVSYGVLAFIQYLIAVNFENRMNGIKNSIYNNFHIMLLSFVTTIICLSGILLYKFYMLRYLIIFLIIFICSLVIYRNRNQIKFR